MIKKMLGLSPSENQNCLNCKYSYRPKAACLPDGRVIGDVHCEIGKISGILDLDEKCWRYIEKDSLLAKLCEDWRFWLMTLLIVLFGIANLVFN